MPSLKECFEDMPDPRRTYLCSHKLIDILMIALCATIAGSDTWPEIVEFAVDREAWLRKFLELPHGIPSHDTFERVFARLNPKAFEKRFLTWVSGLIADLAGQVVAVDGKAIRRAGEKGAGSLYLVSAWATANRLVLGQTKVQDKSNEITAIPELLDCLDLRGCLVTIDAIGCQRKIAQQIIAQGGEYILAVKENQPGLRAHLQKVLAGATPQSFPAEAQYAKSVCKGHGRLEIRHCWVLADDNSINYVQQSQERWANLRCLIKVSCLRKPLGESLAPDSAPDDERYYICSLPLSPQQALDAIRSHWQIENSLHWCLDIAFREDESRYRTGNGPENLAVVRHLAMNILKQDHQAKTGIHARRLRAARSTNYLERVLGW